MVVNTRELRRRIKSTKSIRQITKAMEMIAAGKMRKAQMAALASRPYANLAWEMLASLGRGRIEDYEHPFLRSSKYKGESSKQLIILITSNRGLCGSLNTQVIQKAISHKPYVISYIVVGRKGQRALARLGKESIAAFDGFETIPTVAETRPIAKIAMDEFIAGRADSVALVYADFISTLRYVPAAHTVLPIVSRLAEQQTGRLVENKSANLPIAQSPKYLFEPSPAEVLDELLPRLVELQVYQAILETLASEHSARMVAMKNASEAAGDLIEDFTLTYNSVRQASITRELADIVGGRMALHV